MTALRPAVGPAVEIALPLAVVATTAWLVFLGALGLDACIWVTLSLLLTMLLLSWKRFEGGRHPCFLFLGMLLIFQGGRLVGFAAGLIDNPMQIVVSVAMPLSISTSTAETTLLLIALSAILIYAPCRLGAPSRGFWAGNARQWLPGLYVLVALTLPFALYKNLMYLTYIRAHGGYLAVFTDNAGVLASAGWVARTVSTINETAILTAYILETRRGRRNLILILFFSMAALDLLIGFRGKFFAEAISIWYINNLRTGRRFRLIPLTIIAVAASVGAVLIAGFRENQSVALLSPLGFLVTQGVSMNVTEAAVQYHHLFSRFGWDYLWNGLLNGVTPVGPGTGKLWTWDLTVFLNPVAFEHGYGTASSYLAELYLFAGLPAVIFGSLVIGYCLNLLHRASARLWGALLLAFVLPSVIYLPRLELLNPVAIAIKSLISLGVVVAFVVGYRTVAGFLGRGATGELQAPAKESGDGDAPDLSTR
jgi:hypothetical protein